MKCPVCRHKTRVMITRKNVGFNTERTRECTDCLTRFETIEIINKNSIPDYILNKVEAKEDE